MSSRALAIFWIILAAAIALLAFTSPPTDDTNRLGFENVVKTIAIAVVAVSLLGILPTPIRDAIATPLRLLRSRSWLYSLFVLFSLCWLLGLWVSWRQPTYGRDLTNAEYAYILFLVWWLVFLLGYGMTRAAATDLGGRFSKSKFTGVFITLLTFAVIYWGAEAYLRIFYITTDAYGFTAMNYHWYNNFYWGKFNSLGYRDYEPKPDPDGALTRVAVVGDSFAVGHGITDMDQSFPQMLEKDLGDSYDVLLVAQSGWDSDVETAYLDGFPLRPNIVVLSYYLNDIDYLMTAPEASPDSNFDFIENENLQWFVLNFFVPNYIYYNLIQFTSPVRTGNFISDLINAHMNDELWNQQVGNLQSMVNWNRDHDSRLIVLLWPHLAAVNESRPATARVREFFESQGVTVVDMTDILQEENPAALFVNRFDTHPSVYAQRLAADALYAAITQ